MYDYSEHTDIWDALESRRYSLVDAESLTKAVLEAMGMEVIEKFDTVEIRTAAHELPPLLKHVRSGKIYHDPYDKAKDIVHAAIVWNFQRSKKGDRRNTLMHVSQPLGHYPELAVTRPNDLLDWRPHRKPSGKKAGISDPEVIRGGLDAVKDEMDTLKVELAELESVETVKKWKQLQRNYEKSRKEKMRLQNQLRRMVSA